MKLITIFFMMCLCLTGCQTPQVYLDIPPALTEVTTVEAIHLFQGLGVIFPDTKQNVSFSHIEDMRYSIAEHSGVLELLNWAATQRDVLLPRGANGRVFQSETFDCDNFARIAVTGADLGAMRGRLTGQVLVSRVNVKQIHEFGRVPAGGLHALNYFVSDQGVFVFEPQSYPEEGSIARVARWEGPVGELLVVENEYPNLEGVYLVKFD